MGQLPIFTSPIPTVATTTELQQPLRQPFCWAQLRSIWSSGCLAVAMVGRVGSGEAAQAGNIPFSHTHCHGWAPIAPKAPRGQRGSVWKWDIPGHCHLPAACPLHATTAKWPKNCHCCQMVRMLNDSPSGYPHWVIPMANWLCWIILWWLGDSELAEATLW